MTGNFIMISEEDLEKAFTKMLENYLSTHKFAEKSSTDEDKYLTSDQVCDHLHVSTTKLWRMEKDGDITAYKLGRRSLYSKKAVDELIKSKNVNAKK